MSNARCMSNARRTKGMSVKLSRMNAVRLAADILALATDEVNSRVEIVFQPEMEGPHRVVAVPVASFTPR